jgi:hypothetical protein
MWSTQACAKSKEQRPVVYFTHSHTGNGDILQISAINAFQRDAAAKLQFAVPDRNVIKTADGLRADLDSAHQAIAGRQPFLSSVV